MQPRGAGAVNEREGHENVEGNIHRNEGARGQQNLLRVKTKCLDNRGASLVSLRSGLKAARLLPLNCTKCDGILQFELHDQRNANQGKTEQEWNSPRPRDQAIRPCKGGHREEYNIR
jgi:hypothetical protein